MLQVKAKRFLYSLLQPKKKNISSAYSLRGPTQIKFVWMVHAIAFTHFLDVKHFFPHFKLLT